MPVPAIFPVRMRRGCRQQYPKYSIDIDKIDRQLLGILVNG
ncbi:hypothetical protein QUA20_19435 [Microcoleus sp. Pol7_A1]